MYHEFPTRPPGRTAAHERSQRVAAFAASAIVLSILGLGAAGAIVGEVGLTSADRGASTDAPAGREPGGPLGSTGTATPSTLTPTPSAPSKATVSPAPTSGRSLPPTEPSTPATPRPGSSVPGTGPTASASPRPAPGGPGGVPATHLHPVVGVIDGDTIKVRVGGTTERVRLLGLDAPELATKECWAKQASSRMQSLVQSRSVQLVRDPSQADRDRYGRLLRHVSTADGQLVAQVLIEGGFARELTHAGRYEHQAAFRAAEKRAKAQRLGIWGKPCAGSQGEGRPRPSSTTAPPVSPQGGCVVKGNINREGEKIFHVPGGRSYDETVITPSKGERWFCSEQQALDAGWRKARS